MNATPTFIIAQLIGLLAVAGSFLSFQMSTQKKLLIVQIFSTAAACIHYLLLGATSGMVLNLLGIFRNIIFCNRDKKYLSSPAIPVIFAVIFTIMGALSWQGWYSIFIVAAMPINALFLGQDDPQKTRASILLTSSMVIVYNCFVYSISGILYEVVGIASASLGLWRNRKVKN